jgi:hypothetical protein
MRTEMASKKHRPEEALAKLRQVDVLVPQGQPVAEAVRTIGMTEVTLRRTREEYQDHRTPALSQRTIAGDRSSGGERRTR